jgi:Glycosyltransferase family 87
MSVLSENMTEPQIQRNYRSDSRGKKILRRLAAAAIVLAGLLVISVTGHPASKDYISYWSAGKLLIHHANPYSRPDVLELERTHGFPETRPLMMRNPPWALFLTAPLGFGDPAVGLFLWTLAAAGCLVAFIRLLKVPVEDRALVFLFAPTIAVFRIAQTSPFLLLGFSLFLYLHRRRPFLAGASLLFMAIKPHLFLVFWAVLLADSIYRRRLLVFAGLAAALAAGTTFAMYFNTHIWQHYVAMLRGSDLDSEFFPTTSMMFRLLIDSGAIWLLFIPSAVAIVWGLWYYIRNRRVWHWGTHGMLLMLVTVMVSPYSWFPDEIVLLPALAFAITFPYRRALSLEILVVINVVAILVLMAGNRSIVSMAYLWTPSAWLAWFLYATNGFRIQSGNLTIQPKEIGVFLASSSALVHQANLSS